MRKKGIIIISVILLVILGFGFWLYLSFNGSLLKRLVMTKNAEQYVQMFYPEEDLEVDFAVYDFKMCAYYCKVHAPSGGDLYFHVYRNSDGELTDDFGTRVLQKENTILRLGTELDEYTDAFPFVTQYSLSIQDRYVEKDGTYEPEDHSGDISVFGVPAEIIETDRLENWLENEKQKQKAE